jgi:hypothetical protein
MAARTQREGESPAAPPAAAALDKANRLLSESATLDRLLRCAAYGSLLLKGVLLRAGADEAGELVRRVSDVYAKLSTTRFVAHVNGTPAQVAAALRTARAASGESARESLLRQLQCLQHMSMSLYFPAEHMIFLARLAPKLPGVASDALWLRRCCMAWAMFNFAGLAETLLRRYVPLAPRRAAFRALPGSPVPPLPRADPTRAPCLPVRLRTGQRRATRARRT